MTIELGAGKAIQSVRHISELMPSHLIRINPREADGPAGVISIELSALEALTRIHHFL